MAPQLEAAAESKVSTPARSSPPPAHSLPAVARLHRSAMIPLTGGLPFFRRSVTMSAFVCVCVRAHTLHVTEVHRNQQIGRRNVRQWKVNVGQTTAAPPAWRPDVQLHRHDEF